MLLSVYFVFLIHYLKVSHSLVQLELYSWLTIQTANESSSSSEHTLTSSVFFFFSAIWHSRWLLWLCVWMMAGLGLGEAAHLLVEPAITTHTHTRVCVCGDGCGDAAWSTTTPCIIICKPFQRPHPLCPVKSTWVACRSWNCYDDKCRAALNIPACVQKG